MCLLQGWACTWCANNQPTMRELTREPCPVSLPVALQLLRLCSGHPALLSAITTLRGPNGLLPEGPEDVSFLERLPRLTSMQLCKPRSLFDVQRLSGLHLTELRIAGAYLADLMPLRCLSGLSSLVLRQVWRYQCVEELTRLTSLQLLDTPAIAAISTLTTLSTLTMTHHHHKQGALIPSLPALTRLSVACSQQYGAHIGKAMAAFALLPALRALSTTVWDCSHGDVPQLSRLSTLSVVYGSGVPSTQDFSALPGLQQLELANFEGAPTVIAPSVTMLKLRFMGHAAPRPFPDITACTSLQKLQVFLYGTPLAVLLTADKLPPQTLAVKSGSARRMLPTPACWWRWAWSPGCSCRPFTLAGVDRWRGFIRAPQEDTLTRWICCASTNTARAHRDDPQTAHRPREELVMPLPVHARTPYLSDHIADQLVALVVFSVWHAVDDVMARRWEEFNGPDHAITDWLRLESKRNEEERQNKRRELEQLAREGGASKLTPHVRVCSSYLHLGPSRLRLLQMVNLLAMVAKTRALAGAKQRLGAQGYAHLHCMSSQRPQQLTQVLGAGPIMAMSSAWWAPKLGAPGSTPAQPRCMQAEGCLQTLAGKAPADWLQAWDELCSEEPHHAASLLFNELLPYGSDLMETPTNGSSAGVVRLVDWLSLKPKCDSRQLGAACGCCCCVPPHRWEKCCPQTSDLLEWHRASGCHPLCGRRDPYPPGAHWCGEWAATHPRGLEGHSAGRAPFSQPRQIGWHTASWHQDG